MNNQNFNKDNDDSFQNKEKLYVFLIIIGFLLIITLLVVFFTYKPEDVVEEQPVNKEIVDNNPVSINTYPYKTEKKRDSYQFSVFEDYEKVTSINSKYMALIDLDNMEIILGRDYSVQFYPASMTKVMTTIVALDHIKDLDEKYKITKTVLNRVSSESSVANLKLLLGEEVTIRSLLYGVTYRSGADAVLCLVDALGYTVSEYVELMNEKAKEIGLTSTKFGGVIGMDDENNQTTARDMAMIFAFVADNPQCMQFFSGQSYRLTSNLLFYNATLVNTLESYGYTPTTLVSGFTMVGAKSGYETKAGSCLVSYTESSSGKKYILVTAKADTKQDYVEDYRKIFNLIK